MQMHSEHTYIYKDYCLVFIKHTKIFVLFT